MTTTYRELEKAQAKPTRIADHAAAWAELPEVGAVNGVAASRIEAFCEQKQISLRSLEALGTRVLVERSSGGVALAWGYQHAGAVTALKFRPLAADKRPYAADPSVYLEPLVLGNRQSLEWFVAEGETDACRLYELVGDEAAVLCLPAGALTFKPEWANPIPRGATVHLGHDADQAGDQGAGKAAQILGGRTIRVRPPIEGSDWCDWDGDRDMFVELVRAARSSKPRFEFASLTDFLVHPFPKAEPLLGKAGTILLARGSLLMVYGADGSGKSTWTIDGVAHLGAGREWLGIPVLRPVRFCIIENEGPPDLFQQKLAAKIASWDGAEFEHNLYAFKGPWGEFSFADSEARSALAGFCEEHAIDVVVANPTLGLGVAASGRPDETQAFVDWLTECGLKSTRAFWLLHHENKAGQISGDWGRHPDTKVQLQQDGNHLRTKLEWAKTRWATLPSETIPKTCMLEWLVATQGYSVTLLDSVGATDNELRDRVDTFLADHPWSSTTVVETTVKGTASRIRKLLESGHYDSVRGKRGATLWALCDTFAATPSEAADDGVTG